MANWKYKLNIKDEWQQSKAGKLDYNSLAKIIATKLDKFGTDDDDLTDIIVRFLEYADNGDDVEEFDDIMEQLYDWGDTLLDDSSWPHKKMCWIGTF